MPDRTRPIRKEICLNEQELSVVRHKMNQLGTRNFGAYARKMLIDGYIIKVDYTEQKKLAAAVSRAASNINQICRRINSTQLSQRSGWADENGSVYVIYSIRQMADDLNRSERTVKNALNELENAGLLLRVRQGWNRANRLFLQVPDEVQVSSRPEGNICPMDVQDSSPCMGQNLPASNTDTEYKEYSETEKVESTRRRYGEFQNVFLSGEECIRLEAAYPGKAAVYIERLSRYMASNDRHYANHYATIKKWLDEDSKGRSAKNYTYDDNEGECL